MKREIRLRELSHNYSQPYSSLDISASSILSRTNFFLLLARSLPTAHFKDGLPKFLLFLPNASMGMWGTAGPPGLPAANIQSLLCLGGLALCSFI